MDGSKLPNCLKVKIGVLIVGWRGQKIEGPLSVSEWYWTLGKSRVSGNRSCRKMAIPAR